MDNSVYSNIEKFRDDKQTVKEFAKIASEVLCACAEQDSQKLGDVLLGLLKEASDPVIDYAWEKLKELQSKEGSIGEILGKSIGLMGLAQIPKMLNRKSDREKEYRRSQHVFNKVVNSEPALRDNLPESREHFHIIRKFSPSLLHAPAAVKNVMLDWHRMDGKSIQPEMIHKLMTLEKTRTDIESRPNTGFASAFGDNIGAGVGRGAGAAAFQRATQSRGGP